MEQECSILINIALFFVHVAKTNVLFFWHMHKKKMKKNYSPKLLKRIFLLFDYVKRHVQKTVPLQRAKVFCYFVCEK